MKNELLKLGAITINGYGLMIAIGVLSAYTVTIYRAKKSHLNHERIFGLTMWALAGGMLGAKLLYYITEIKTIMADPKIILNISDGYVVYGGIIGGVLAGYLYCRKANLHFLRYLDLCIPTVALAQGFGRIGCFLAGCCYGRETSSPFGIIFHDSAYAPNGVRLVPTQLISSGLDFLNFFVLVILSRRKKVDGQVAGLYLIFYSVGRFFIEFYRGDLIRGSVGRLSTSQFISIFMFIAGWILILASTYYFKNLNKNQQAI